MVVVEREGQLGSSAHSTTSSSTHPFFWTPGKSLELPHPTRQIHFALAFACANPLGLRVRFRTRVRVCICILQMDILFAFAFALAFASLAIARTTQFVVTPIKALFPHLRATSMVLAQLELEDTRLVCSPFFGMLRLSGRYLLAQWIGPAWSPVRRLALFWGRSVGRCFPFLVSIPPSLVPPCRGLVLLPLSILFSLCPCLGFLFRSSCDMRRRQEQHVLRVESLVVGDHCLFEPFGDIHSCLACALGELLLGEHHKTVSEGNIWQYYCVVVSVEDR